MNSNWFLIGYTLKKDLQGNSGFEFSVTSDTELSKQNTKLTKKQRQFQQLKVTNNF